jgi:hypothetical protein
LSCPALANSLGVPTGALLLAAKATFFEHRVQRLEACHLRDWHHEVGTGEFYQALDLAFVVSFGWPPEPVLEQIVADKLGEGSGPLAFAVTADFGPRFWDCRKGSTAARRRRT